MKLHRRSAGQPERVFSIDDRVEALEARLLLAGSLRITTNRAGDITLRGDGRSNYVEVSREWVDQNGDGDTNDIVIRGLNDTTGAATSIRDGRNTVSQHVIDGNGGAITNKLRITLGGGNDFITFRGVELHGDVNFQAGGGSDSFGFFGGSVANGYAKFVMGGGNDYLNVKDGAFNGIWDVNTGGGVDYIGLSAFSSAAGALAKFNTGSGPDVLYIEDSTVDGDITASMGSLIDTVFMADGTVLNGNITIDMGTLFDLLVLENDVDLSNAHLNISGGRGGFGYENLLFVYDDSPFLSDIPNGVTGFDIDYYTTSGNATTGFDITTTLSRWIMDLYYPSTQPAIHIDVVDTFLAANIARGFDYADLPRSDLGPAPNPADIAAEVAFFLGNSSFYGYQTFFVRGAFNTEISTFDWERFA